MFFLHKWYLQHVFLSRKGQKPTEFWTLVTFIALLIIMSFSRRGCVHACSDCKAPSPGTSCGVSVLPQYTQSCVHIGNNCKTKWGEGPGWQGYTGWSELFSHVNAWESMLIQTMGVMGVLEPARCSYEGWPAIKQSNINRDRWEDNLFLKICSLQLFTFYFSSCITCILDVMSLERCILMMLLIHYYINAIPRALYTSIFVPLCSALVKRLQIQFLFLHINQQSALCNNYTCNCLYICTIMMEKQLWFAAILV